MSQQPKKQNSLNKSKSNLAVDAILANILVDTSLEEDEVRLKQKHPTTAKQPSTSKTEG
jgi:hypothetical protein